MIRISVLLLLLITARAQAQGPGGGAFDPRIVTSVYVEALSFMAPRILEPVPISQMTLWGLRGLTALDPSLTTTTADGRIRLLSQARPVFEAPAPRDENPVSWANTAAAMAVAAGNLSPAVRQAGGQAIIQSFFDELFNHLDPYSRYVAPAAADEDREKRDGRAGLGIGVVARGGVVTVRSVIRDGPGELMGLRVGDTIIAIDRKPVRGLDARAVMELLEGEEDSAILLNWRTREGRVREAQVAREMVPPETVFSEMIGNILLVRITGFSRTTDSHLLLVMRDAFGGGRPVDGIIVDLRGNRGGLVRQAVSVADILLPPGVVAITAGRAPEANHVWRSFADELGEDIPAVVIVDGRTASAAEILAAALADRGRAVVVGSSTLGKGLVQTIDPMPDGGELFVTWSRILAPLGWPIHGLGLLPQVCTSRGQDVLRRQLDALASRRQLMAGDIAAHRRARAPLTPARIQAIRNTCPPGEGREADIEAARMLIANPIAYETALLPAREDLR